jgi:transcriptional regulator with XRE-family HTH domain
MYTSDVLNPEWSILDRHCVCKKYSYFEAINYRTMGETAEKKIHQGRNVKRFREMLGMKQEGLAMELGEDWSQRRVSLLEAKEEIEPEILEQVAKVLKVPSEAIKNFDELAAINIISNTFHDFKDNAVANANHCTFNPLDKVIELYERMLKDKTEMIEKLEQMLLQKK